MDHNLLEKTIGFLKGSQCKTFSAKLNSYQFLRNAFRKCPICSLFSDIITSITSNNYLKYNSFKSKTSCSTLNIFLLDANNIIRKFTVNGEVKVERMLAATLSEL